MKKIKISIVGLGHQASEDHIPAIIESENCGLLSVCDIDENKVQDISSKFNIDGFMSIDDLLKKSKPDVIILAVPHNQYFHIISKIARNKIHIIKEKPFATSIEDAIRITNVVERNKIFLGVTLQRRFNPIFKAFMQLKQRIGKIYFIDGIYGMNIRKLDNSWRSYRKFAGGGALIDMGYHFIDLLIWYMGMPNLVEAKMSTGNRENQYYDVEDIVNLSFDYSKNNYQEKTIGRFLISRVHHKKEEYIIFYGTKGSIRIERGKISRFDINGNLVDFLERKDGWSSASLDQLKFFIKIIEGENKYNYSFKNHFKHVSVIHSAYKSNEENISVNPNHFYSKLRNL